LALVVPVVLKLGLATRKSATVVEQEQKKHLLDKMNLE